MSRGTVFVSYSHREADWAKNFARALADRGVHVWLDQFEVKAGERLQEATEKGLRESELFVTLIDPANIKNPSLLFELGAAIAMGKRVVAIVPEDFDPSELPLPFRARRFLKKGPPDSTADALVATQQHATSGA
jgi:nucleoside 2-deoxyribosyltransferase